MRRGQAVLLARHFFWRFFDNDLVSPDSDAHQAASIAIAFVAVPGILVSGFLFLRYGNPWLSAPNRLSLALVDKLQFICWSMEVMALATIVVWDALALDSRDYAVLGPLPISRSTLLAGKLVATGWFVAVFALAVNAVPIVLFPAAVLSSSRLPLTVGAWVMAGHAIATLSAALFAFLAVLAARGLLLNLLGPRLFARASLPAQFVMALFVITGSSGVSVSALDHAGARLYLSPPMWFLGLYETIADRGIMATLSPAVQSLYGLVDVGAPHAPLTRQTYVGYWPVFQHLAAFALSGLAIAVFLATALYFASHFRHASRLRQAATVPSRGGAVARALGWLARGVIVRDTIARASFFFTMQTLGRSARHRLYVAGYFLVGCVLTYTAAMSLAATKDGSAGDGPASDALAIQVVLAFFLIVGIRVAFSFPAELRANWIFRLVAGGEVDVKRYLAGVRRAVGYGFILPFFLALVPVHAVLWGTRAAGLHFACGLLWALILAELLLLGLTKLPFACPHVSGGGNLKVLGGPYVVAFLVYAYGFAAIERVALQTATGSAVLISTLAFVLASLALYRSRLLRRQSGFVFDERPDPALVTLGL